MNKGYSISYYLKQIGMAFNEFAYYPYISGSEKKLSNSM